jgi:protoporphyrinogen/coproporphyrinogen III oxidase
MKIAVVGAGIAGLAIAHRLMRAHDVRVFERSERPGGKIRSETLDGYLFEWGPSGYLSDAAELQGLVEEVGLAPQVQAAASAASSRLIYWNGKLHRLPRRPTQIFDMSLVSPVGKLALLREPFVSRLPQRETERDESVFEFVERRVGREFAERLISPALLGISGGDARQTSLDALFPRLRALEHEYGSLILGSLRGGRKAGHLTAFGAAGMQALITRLTELLGARLQTGVGATRLERDGDAWKLTLQRGADGPLESYAPDCVVLAIPAYDAAGIVVDLDAPLAAELHGIPYAAMKVAGIGFHAKDVIPPLDAFGFLVARGFGVKILGALYISTIFPQQAPPGVAYFRTFLGGTLDPESAVLGELRARAQICADLRTTLGIEAEPLVYHETNWPRAIPQYRLDHRARMRRIDERLSRLPGLELAGNAYRGLGLGDNVRDALAVAERIARETPAGIGPATSQV